METAIHPIGPELESIAMRRLFGFDLGYNDVRVRSRCGCLGTMIGWLTFSDEVAVLWDFDGKVEEVPIGDVYCV